MELLHATTRREWRQWLSKNHDTAKEIWLVGWRKSSGKTSLSHDVAVEEALCYGWIDSTRKRVDDDRLAQRYSPRRKTSGLSQLNLERVRSLIARKKMTKAGLAAIAHVFDPATDDPDAFTIPADILRALQKDEPTWTNFQAFPAQYQRIRIAWIDGARHRPDEFKKRRDHFLKMTRQNKTIEWSRAPRA